MSREEMFLEGLRSLSKKKEIDGAEEFFSAFSLFFNGGWYGGELAGELTENKEMKKCFTKICWVVLMVLASSKNTWDDRKKASAKVAYTIWNACGYKAFEKVFGFEAPELDMGHESISFTPVRQKMVDTYGRDEAFRKFKSIMPVETLYHQIRKEHSTILQLQATYCFRFLYLTDKDFHNAADVFGLAVNQFKFPYI